MIWRQIGTGLAMLVALGLAACGLRGAEDTHAAEQQVRPDDATLARGEASFRRNGCGACHHLATIAGARGVTGPPLDDLFEQVYIAGHLPNTPDHVAHFVERPHEVDPATAMPSIGLSAEEARAIAQFLLHPR